MSVDEVRYDIQIDAKAALAAMQELLQSTNDNSQKIVAFTGVVQSSAQRWGVSWQQALQAYRQLNQELSKGHEATIFGNVGGQDLMKATEQYMAVKEAAGTLIPVNNEVATSEEKIGTSAEKMGASAEAGSTRAVRSIDAVRIALGAIVAMIVFQVIQAFTQFFTQAIDQARQLEGVLYNVANAERIMSQQGIEIAPKDIQDMIDKLQKLIPMLSQLDATKAVGNLALFTKDLGYTKDEIGNLADAIGVLYVRNRSLGLSFEQVQSQVQTGLLTGRAQGIRDLGVSISESAIQAEALRMGLVKTDKEFTNLTGDVQTQVKAQAMLSIILHSTSEELKGVQQYAQTADGQISTFSGRVKDLGLSLGKILTPALGGLAKDGIVALGALTNFIDHVRAALYGLVTTFVIVISAADLIPKMIASGAIRSVSDLKDALSQIKSQVEKNYKDILGFSRGEDTATSSTKDLTSALVDLSKVNLDSLNNSILSLQERISQLNRDFAQHSANYLQEFNTKMSRMQQDYQTEVASVVQDFNNKRADAEAKYRNAQLDAEAKYQEQLRELRTKYLFDLEDALRNRDARQVLRLQAQYKMDKDNLTHNFEIENAARARQYKLELSQLARQEAQKLAEMAAAEATKEARAREDFAREQAQRKQEYDNQLADLKQSWQDKLDEEKAKIAEQLGVTGKGVDAIKILLEKYYGSGGVFDGLYKYSFDSLSANGQAMLAEMAGVVAQYMAMAAALSTVAPAQWSEGGPVAPPATGGGMNPNPNPGGLAEGGMIMANKATDVTFGEAGPEAAIFLPLSKLMSGMPKLGGIAGGDGASGKLTVLLELSPDLEARITENTLGKAAKVITQVYRGRR